MSDDLENSSIHHSAVIEGEVVCGDGVEIGPFCHLIGPVKIGSGTSIGSFCYIQGPVEIGKRNRINPHCIIGTDGESRDKNSTGLISIGDDNVLSELTVIQRGTGDRNTQIGNYNFLMDNTHIAHDCKVGNNVTIAPNVVLGGHTLVQDFATIGIGVSIHQFSTIGAYSMIGMNSTITKDVPPFALVSGSPAKYRRWNHYQLKKLGMQKTPNGEEYENYLNDFKSISSREIILIQSEEM